MDDQGRLVAAMVQLAAAGDGWINLVPQVAEEDVPAPSLRFFTLFSGGGSGATMGTWVPGAHERRGTTRPSLGIMHVAGTRVVAELRSLSLPVPAGWIVEQDHPRRGLVLRIPLEEPHEQVLAWSIRAVAALAPGPIRKWSADIHLPAEP